jgi:hypothetical protein
VDADLKAKHGTKHVQTARHVLASLIHGGTSDA